MVEVSFQYAKRRCDYGRQPMFCERGPELCDSVAPDPLLQRHYILRNPVHQPTQHTPVFAQCDINTVRAEYTTGGANHAEGGWPRDVNVTDPEATQRYRRKEEKDDNYIHCVMSIAPGMEHYVQQNNAIEMYQTYYTELPSVREPERTWCRTVNVLRDPGGARGARRAVSACWQPDSGRRLAVTYLDVDFYRNPRAGIDCYIWNIEHTNAPEVTVTPPCPLLELMFSPRDRTVLAGALMSGQVGVWDRRAGGAAMMLSPEHTAHRDLARNVLFINTKSGQEFFSSGPDGAVKWWDMRDMSGPTDEMVMDVVYNSWEVPSMARAHGVTVLEYEPTIPSRFMAGCEDGLVLCGNRKGKTPIEKLPAKFTAHLGPVWSLQRNPNFLKNFLTVGEWRLRVWSEECRESAVLWSPPQRHKVTSATWSPTRLSLLLASRWDGVLECWDFLRTQHRPVLSMQVCSEPLTLARVHGAGSLVACGAMRGNVFLAELSPSLAQSDAHDKGLLTAVFERESKRERILEARMREIRVKLRQAEEGSPVTSATTLDPSLGDKDLAEATQAYVSTVKKELAAI